MDSNPFPISTQPALHHQWNEQRKAEQARNQTQQGNPLRDQSMPPPITEADKAAAVAEAERIITEARRGQG